MSDIGFSISMPLTLEDVEAYLRFKMYDSLENNGSYKKFLIARKEQGYPWAIDMVQKIHNLQNAIKMLEQKEAELKTSQLSNLYIIWQHVTESNLPPVDLQLTIATCMISKRKNIPCVIVRGKGRGAQPFTINSKFGLFLQDLWVVYKIDFLIKTFSKQKINSIDEAHAMPILDIVKILDEDKDKNIHHLAGALFMAFSHVYKSTVYGINALI